MSRTLSKAEARARWQVCEQKITQFVSQVEALELPGISKVEVFELYDVVEWENEDAPKSIQIYFHDWPEIVQIYALDVWDDKDVKWGARDLNDELEGVGLSPGEALSNLRPDKITLFQLADHFHTLLTADKEETTASISDQREENQCPIRHSHCGQSRGQT